LGNYSFFIRPGYTRIGLRGAEDLDTVVASAYMAPDTSRIVIVFVNSSFTMAPARISFLRGWNKKVKKVAAFSTDDRTDLANVFLPEKFSPKEVYNIPARSLITMVFDF
jgi:hypothetical protein